jgi:hypothetical protein
MYCVFGCVPWEDIVRLTVVPDGKTMVLSVVASEEMCDGVTLFGAFVAV